MQIIACDRCGKFISPHQGEAQVSVENGIEKTSFVLCQACTSRHKDFFLANVKMSGQKKSVDISSAPAK